MGNWARIIRPRRRLRAHVPGHGRQDEMVEALLKAFFMQGIGFNDECGTRFIFCRLMYHGASLAHHSRPFIRRLPHRAEPNVSRRRPENSVCSVGRPV